MDPRFLDSIRRFEGFTPRAEWDYAQHTNGYGTKARYPGEVIAPGEAERRFRDEIARAAAVVDRFAPHLDGGTRAALTSLTFNAGPRWMQSGLGAAIKAGDLAVARSIFVQYANAGGEVLPGLLARRVEESRWFGTDSAEVPRAEAPVSARPDESALAGSAALKDTTRTRSHAVADGPVRASAAPEARDTMPGLAVEVLALWEQIRIDHVRLLTLRKGEATRA